MSVLQCFRAVVAVIVKRGCWKQELSSSTELHRRSSTGMKRPFIIHGHCHSFGPFIINTELQQPEITRTADSSYREHSPMTKTSGNSSNYVGCIQFVNTDSLFYCVVPFLQQVSIYLLKLTVNRTMFLLDRLFLFFLLLCWGMSVDCFDNTGSSTSLCLFPWSTWAFRCLPGC